MNEDLECGPLILQFWRVIEQAVTVLPGNRIMVVGGEGDYDNNTNWKYPKHVNEVNLPPKACYILLSAYLFRWKSLVEVVTVDKFEHHLF